MTGGTSSKQPFLDGASKYLLPVIYHYVRAGEDANFPGLHFVSLSGLRHQIEQLGRWFDFPDPEEVRTMLLKKQTPEQSICMLTFDDGLLEHYEQVLPILDQMRIKGAFFISTGPWEDGRMLSVHMVHLLLASASPEELICDFDRAATSHGLDSIASGVPEEKARDYQPYDSLDVAKLKYCLNVMLDPSLKETVVRKVFEVRLGSVADYAEKFYMQPKMARDMVIAGHAVGMHSHRHLNLGVTEPSLRRSDMDKNRTFLAEALGCESRGIRWISYPYGARSSCGEEVVAEAKSMGCDVGFTTIRRLNRLPAQEPMLLDRLDTVDIPGGKRQRSWTDFVP